MQALRRISHVAAAKRCATYAPKNRARRRRTLLIASSAIAGLATACASLVAALLGAPTPIFIGLLFGGLGMFAAAALALVWIQRTLVIAERERDEAAPLPSARLHKRARLLRTS